MISRSCIGQQTARSPTGGEGQRPLARGGLAAAELQANGETSRSNILLPPHTDSDIYVHFQKATVISMADTFFNGMYPYIDPGTGGNIDGMIAAADTILSLADNHTRIVAGHGPLATKRTSRESGTCSSLRAIAFNKLKSAGKSAQEAAAEKPFADLDPPWGNASSTATSGSTSSIWRSESPAE